MPDQKPKPKVGGIWICLKDKTIMKLDEPKSPDDFDEDWVDTRTSLSRSDFTDAEWAEMKEDLDFCASMRPSIEKLARGETLTTEPERAHLQAWLDSGRIEETPELLAAIKEGYWSLYNEPDYTLEEVLEGLHSPDPKAFHEKLYAEKMKTFVPEIPDPEMAAWLASDSLDFPVLQEEIGDGREKN